MKTADTVARPIRNLALVLQRASSGSTNWSALGRRTQSRSARRTTGEMLTAITRKISAASAAVSRRTLQVGLGYSPARSMLFSR